MPLRNTATIVHDVGAVGNAQRLTDVVVGNQHADATLLEVKDDRLNVSHGNRIDAGKGLVEQDERW